LSFGIQAALPERHDQEETLPKGFEAWASDHAFILDWMRLDPPLGRIDLRGALHVGRETLPLLSERIQLSEIGQEALERLVALNMRAPKEEYCALLTRVAPEERTIISDRLLERAGMEKEWGVPDITWGLAVMAEADAEAATSVVDFLQNRPSEMLSPPIVPCLSSFVWGGAILDIWEKRTDLSKPLQRALMARKKGRN
jgi:predicted KAP-like P-loop ATPase